MSFEVVTGQYIAKFSKWFMFGITPILCLVSLRVGAIIGAQINQPEMSVEQMVDDDEFLNQLINRVSACIKYDEEQFANHEEILELLN